MYVSPTLWGIPIKTVDATELLPQRYTRNSYRKYKNKTYIWPPMSSGNKNFRREKISSHFADLDTFSMDSYYRFFSIPGWQLIWLHQTYIEAQHPGASKDHSHRMAPLVAGRPQKKQRSLIPDHQGAGLAIHRHPVIASLGEGAAQIPLMFQRKYIPSSVYRNSYKKGSGCGVQSSAASY